jgi:hypothetical protein
VTTLAVATWLGLDTPYLAQREFRAARATKEDYIESDIVIGNCEDSFHLIREKTRGHYYGHRAFTTCAV